MTDSKNGIISKLSHFIVKHPWLWVFVALLITGAALFFLQTIEYEFSLEALFSSDSLVRKQHDEFVDIFGRDDNVMIIAHGAKDIFSPTGYARIKEITEKLGTLPYFDYVISLTSAKTVKGTADGFEFKTMLDVEDPLVADWNKLKTDLLADPHVKGALVSEDGFAISFSMEIKEKYNNNDGRAEVIEKVEKIIQPYQNAGEFHLSGIPHLRNAYVNYMKRDQSIFIPLCTLVVNILAFWLFRTVKANAFSLTIVILSVLWTMGALSAGGGSINIITSVMPSLLMTLGMAYVIHFLSRYIEESSNGCPKTDAVYKATKHMMLPIFLTSFTTGIGFISLVVLKVELIKQFGLYSAIGLLFAFWLTLTLLPTLCLMTKPIKSSNQLFSDNHFVGRYLAWNDKFVKRHPWPVIIISLMLVGASIFFITKVRVDSKIMEELNPDSPEYAAHEFLVNHLAGIVPLEIVLTSKEKDAFKEPVNIEALKSLQDFVRQQDGVDYTFSFADIMMKMNQAFHEDKPEHYLIPPSRKLVSQELLLYDGDELGRLVTGRFDMARISVRCEDIGSKKFVTLEKDILEKANEILPARMKVSVTGSSIMAGKTMSRFIKDMVTSLFIAAGIITVLMAFLFKSVRLGLLAMIPNFIPILMTLGILGLLDITLRTSIVVVFSISLGIAVDDTIHFITRYRNEYKKSGNYNNALTNTFLGSGRPIIFTSLLLFLGFGVLATSSFVPTQNFGMLSAVTMVSALLGDLFLLPALLWVVKPKLY